MRRSAGSGTTHLLAGIRQSCDRVVLTLYQNTRRRHSFISTAPSSRVRPVKASGQFDRNRRGATTQPKPFRVSHQDVYCFVLSRVRAALLTNAITGGARQDPLAQD